MKVRLRIKKEIIILLILLSAAAFGQEKTETQTEREMPSYESMMFWNSVLPGTAQITLGQYGEGAFYITSSLILVPASAIMLVYYFLLNPNSFDLGFYSHNGKTYAVPPLPNEAQMQSRWLFYGGLALSVYASLVSAYSSYSAHRDYTDSYDTDNPVRGKESLADLLLAPYNPENIVSWDFFPVFPMSVALQLAGKDFSAVSAFFGKESVDFFGFAVSPWAGLALNTAFAFVLVTANATWEEIWFRGLSLERNGGVSSSISFGAAHLGNVLIQGASIEDTVLQALDATLIGFYLSYVTEKNGHKLGKAVAIHFWHNILSFALGYMISRGNDEVSTFRITFRIGY